MGIYPFRLSASGRLTWKFSIPNVITSAGLPLLPFPPIPTLFQSRNYPLQSYSIGILLHMTARREYLLSPHL